MKDSKHILSLWMVVQVKALQARVYVNFSKDALLSYRVERI